METTTCPFCDTAGEPALVDDGWTARRCPQCRLAFLSPRPSAADVTQMYEHDEAHGTASMHLTHFGTSTGRFATRKSLRLIRRHTSGGRFLEIGPGGGEMLRAATAAGFNVGSVELNPMQAEFIRKQLGIPCWDSLTGVEGEFDVVYHCDVLSHFFDPVAAFQRIHQLLRPGGIHVFETGEGDFHERYNRLFPSFQFPDHLYLFSELGLRRLLERSEFRHIKTKRYSLVPQLMFEHSFISRVKRRSGYTADSSTLAATPNRRLLPVLGALSAVRHAVRYGAGRIAPKRRRPQTVIVLAVKDS